MTLRLSCLAEVWLCIVISGFCTTRGWTDQVASGHEAGQGRTQSKTVRHEPDADCFGAQAVASGIGKAAINSSVVLKTVTREGRTVAFGTGTIIRRSGNVFNPHNRILTAEHVVRPEFGFPLDGTQIVAVGSDGVELGQIATIETAREVVPAGRVLTRNPKHSLKYPLVDVDFMRRDMAVVSIVWPSSEGWVPFDRREGLEIASVQDSSLLAGRFDRPGGVEVGVSGAAVLDDTGRVVGVMVAKINTDLITHETRAVSSGNSLEQSKDFMPGLRAEAANLQRRNTGAVAPVIDPVLLGALHEAGRNVTANSAGVRDTIRGARMAAYPLGGCIAFEGVIQAMFPGGHNSP
jgi:hypothetical protein